ncbi:hypothetical protein MKW92_024617 [Papaver armeniacum]|nr:hypothetical protein MKW92_024617 [Papaver armeniacum]
MCLRRGAIFTTFIVCYAHTSFISDYVSGGLHSRSGGKSWIKSMIVTASLFPFMCFGIGFALNTISMFYESLATIPTGTMVVVFVIWVFNSFLLALLGTVVLEETGVIYVTGFPNSCCRYCLCYKHTIVGTLFLLNAKIYHRQWTHSSLLHRLPSTCTSTLLTTTICQILVFITCLCFQGLENATSSSTTPVWDLSPSKTDKNQNYGVLVVDAAGVALEDLSFGTSGLGKLRRPLYFLLVCGSDIELM